MSRRRRAALLLGLALLLGGLAASDVARREAALERRLGPPVPVLIARADLAPGTPLSPEVLAVREVPARFAPVGMFASLPEALGRRTLVAVPAGGFVGPAQLEGGGEEGGGLRPGERVADVVAVGSPEAIVGGARVDVVVSREGERGDAGVTVLALEDVEVLAAAPAAAPTAAGPGTAADAPRVAASLRVTIRQAVFLAAAQSFAREVRLLARGPGDRRRGQSGLTVDSTLGP